MDRLGVRRAVNPEGSRPEGRRRNSGFTLLEAVIVLAVGGILAAIALTSFSGLQGNMAVRSAQTNFLTMHAQTRSLAIERGSSMRLTANPGNLVQIEEGCAGGGAVLVSRDFRDSYAVTLNTGGSTLALCMTPKGVRGSQPELLRTAGTHPVREGRPLVVGRSPSPWTGSAPMSGVGGERRSTSTPSIRRVHRAGPAGRAGLSLVELLVAMVILSVGILGMAAGTGWMIRTVDLAQLETERAAALQAGIEEVRALPYQNLGSGGTSQGDFTVSWRVEGQGPNAVLMEFVVEGPGRIAGSFGPVPAISPEAADTLQYRISRP